jgi:hypothetical protein
VHNDRFSLAADSDVKEFRTGIPVPDSFGNGESRVHVAAGSPAAENHPRFIGCRSSPAEGAMGDQCHEKHKNNA